MIQQARERIVVADRSKLGVVASSLICGTDEIHILITDRGATDEQVAPFRARGIDVKRV
jgi:DeoR family transcriptional regulator of aga operon